jgi:enamine deaminase RidA (YjgF/YER057c/UK114 family)
MTLPIDARLADLGLVLPDAPAPAANYVPAVRSGALLFVSGQISQNADGLILGRLGETMDVAAGAEAAKACALSLLAQVRAACDGDLGRLVRVVKLTGFVNSTPDFTDQPKVINGASDLLVALLGDAGRHSRSAVSAAALPLGVAVEIEGIFEIR